MKIFLSCLQSQENRDYSLSYFSHWERNFKKGLEEAGYEWVEAPDVDWARGVALRDEEELDAWMGRAWERTLTFLREAEDVDLFLSYLYPEQVDTAAVKEIEDMGIPCVNFFCDNVRIFDSVPGAYAPFTLHWVPEYEALEMYDAAGLDSMLAAMPCWVPDEYRTPPAEEQEGAVFVGGADPLRKRLIAESNRLGGGIKVYGSGWRSDTGSGEEQSEEEVNRNLWTILRNQWTHVQNRGLVHWISRVYQRIDDKIGQNHLDHVELIDQDLSGPEYYEALRAHEVSIGINRYVGEGSSLLKMNTYSRLRDVEAPMVGACYLTEMTPGLPHYYEAGKEVEVYRTPGELVEKIDLLQNDPERRRILRKNAQRRALQDHSVGRTMKRISTKLGLQ